MLNSLTIAQAGFKLTNIAKAGLKFLIHFFQSKESSGFQYQKGGQFFGGLLTHAWV